jgi:hypothetical protein
MGNPTLIEFDMSEGFCSEGFLCFIIILSAHVNTCFLLKFYIIWEKLTVAQLSSFSKNEQIYRR